MRRAWFRPHRSLPPEAVAFLFIALLALAFYMVAPAPRGAVTAFAAPACADAPQPCRGVR